MKEETAKLKKGFVSPEIKVIILNVRESILTGSTERPIDEDL